MEALENVLQKVRDFFHENSRLKITVVVLIIFMTAAAFISAVIESFSSASAVKKTGIKTGVPFKATDDFFLPPEKELTDSYYFSRETDSAWSQEESDRWFTPVDKKIIDDLDAANDKIIDDIIGAAP